MAVTFQAVSPLVRSHHGLETTVPENRISGIWLAPDGLSEFTSRFANRAAWKGGHLEHPIL